MQKGLKTVLSIVFVVAALGAAFYSTRTACRGPAGGDQDVVMLTCLACKGESQVNTADFAKLANESETAAVRCPKCGKVEAYIASLQCPSCKKWVPRLPGAEGTAFVCPHCKKPLGSGGGG